MGQRLLCKLKGVCKKCPEAFSGQVHINPSEKRILHNGTETAKVGKSILPAQMKGVSYSRGNKNTKVTCHNSDGSYILIFFFTFLFFPLADLKIYMLYKVYFKKSLTICCILMSVYAIFYRIREKYDRNKAGLKF